MARRGDNIRKRKDGRWEGRYNNGRYPNGNIKYGSVYGKTYGEVKEKLNQTRNDEIQRITHSKSQKTFGEITKLWMANNRIRLKGGTITKYQGIIDSHILPELGNIPISEIDTTLVNCFLEMKLTKGRLDGTGGLAPSYVQSITLIINAILKFAAKEQYCFPLNTPISKPIAAKTDLTVLPLECQKRLEMAANNNLSTTSAGIFIALHTGLRIGELCGLSWEDIDLSNKILKVRRTVVRIKKDYTDSTCSTVLVLDSPKTKASIRDIPISSVLFPVLMKLREISPSGFVLTGNDRFLRPRTFEYRYHKVLKEYGVPPTNFHALRHTFATRCIEAGVDVKSLSEILGHANVNITLNTYVHSSIEMKRNQLEKLCTIK